MKYSSFLRETCNRRILRKLSNFITIISFTRDYPSNSLQSKGHGVQLVTSHHDVSHCFQETSDGTLKVTTVGDWLPRSVFGRCYALCAYVRMIYAALYLVVFSAVEYDVIFCDQVIFALKKWQWSRGINEGTK